MRLCFEQLAKVLRTRETQLLRQVQAVQNQQLSMLQTSWNFCPSIPRVEVDLSKRQCLEETILQFGELLSSDTKRITVGDAEPYKIEEYVEANRDHISFDKSIKDDGDKETGVKRAEGSDVFEDSPCDWSFNASSDGDVTLETEITVLLNQNYLSDASTDNHESPEDRCGETKSTTNLADTLENNIVQDSLDFRGVQDNNRTLEHEKTEETLRMSGDCDVPDAKENCDVEISDYFAKEDDRVSSSATGSAESRSPDEIFDKIYDAPRSNGKSRDSEEHPKQIQQWLRQILVETETEPTIHEIEQFAEISKSRFRELQYSLET